MPVLETCEPPCMLLQLSLPLTLQPTTYGEPWDMCQHRSPPLRWVWSGSEGHVSVLDPSSVVKRSLELRTCGSAGPLLVDEGGPGASGYVAVPEPS
jgi:hypothetical protein